MADTDPFARFRDGAGRIVELPRPPEAASGHPDPYNRLRQAALTAGYHAGNGTFWAWHRPAPHAPVDLLTAGTATAPPGTKTKDAQTELTRIARAPAWTEIVVRPNLQDNTKRHKSAHRQSIEASLLGVWTGPFALLVIADPVTPADAKDAIAELADQLRQAQDRQNTSPDHAIAADQLRQRHRELKRAESTGLWNVRILIGAANDRAARTLAALSVASFDLTDLPYTLAPSNTTSPQPPRPPKPDGQLADTKLVAALTRPPTRELPGIRLAEAVDFDLTPEHKAAPTDIPIGTILDHQRRPTGRLELPLTSLNRHTFVCGATGAGKSQTVRGLLESATQQGIPWLVVEPAKSEYRLMSTRLPDEEDVVVIRPGDPNQIPAGIDPLRPADGFPLQTHIDLVRALFLAAFDADEPFPQVLAKALERAYTEQGWDVELSQPRHPKHRPRYPTLRDLQRAAEAVVDEIGYGREVADNVRGFIRVRLASLRLGTTGRFLEGGHPIDIGKLLRSNVVLEIEDIADDRDKAFLMGAVLIALVEHLRVEERKGELTSDRLRHLTVFEEAHRLLRSPELTSGAAAHAVEMFAAMLAEIRAYGEGLIVAEQIPAKLVPDVIKNTSVKIVHRLPAHDDRSVVGATMNLSPTQSRHLVTLEPGIAAVFADGMDHPVLTRMPDGTHRERTTAVRSVGPESVIDAVSGRCASPYALETCTLSEFLRGRRLADVNPYLRLWAELTVVGYLTGSALPRFEAGLAETLGGHDDLVIACALATCIDDAVAARSGVIANRMRPDELAAYVAESLYGAVCGERPLERYRDRWLAGPFRRMTDRARQEALRAPTTVQILYGNDTPSRLESIIGLDRFHDDWDDAVRESTEPFGIADWVVPILATPRRRLDGEPQPMRGIGS